MAEESRRDVPFDLAGFMESAFLMGIGVLEMTREKTQDLTHDLVERGRVSQSEAKKVADRIGEMANEQQEAMRTAVTKETDKVLKTSGVATREDLDSMRAEIAELKSMLAKAQGEAPESAEPTDEA